MSLLHNVGKITCSGGMFTYFSLSRYNYIALGVYNIFKGNVTQSPTIMYEREVVLTIASMIYE